MPSWHRLRRLDLLDELVLDRLEASGPGDVLRLADIDVIKAIDALEELEQAQIIEAFFERVCGKYFDGVTF